MTMNPAEHEAPPTFDSLRLSKEVRQAVDDLGYVHPTPVQRAVFEPASRGRDLVVQARTGTGKTAAFGLPIVDALVKKDASAVQALILCPTRELALQVTRELDALSKHVDVSIVAVYGGAPMPRQVAQLEAGAQVVVGTPGRVLDHLRRGTLDPTSIRIFILDESDEMLSMGFLPQITDILSFLPDGRQTLLFSATLPPDIQRMAETRLKNPEFITLSGDHVGALEIDHFVYMSFGDKAGELLKIIETEDPESAIVFCNTRDETKRVAAVLQQQGFAADWLNADLPQNDREKVMAATRNSELRFLVATDVAARGIDISHLTHVINHDFPESAENYVHRTGRTGRAGRTGTAISLITPSDIGNLYYLRLTYKLKPIERQLPTDRELQTRAQTDLVQMFADLFAARRIHPDDRALARRLMSHELGEEIVANLLRDHLGARPEAVEEATAARRARAPEPVRQAPARRARTPEAPEPTRRAREDR
ncbi:MAG: DEAD/DEAH box helicase, partial [Myxococcales bacterium]|nr:DEAD/DEAH box helicase [Myxococcales bacterium]